MTVRSASHKWPGTFLVLDGPDGAGKTTVGRAVADRLTGEGLRVTCCKDPGGTEAGEGIRSLLLDHDLDGMDIRCEVLLFMASRAQLVADVVTPALERGDVVLCDRFVSATLAYQCAAGADFDAIIRLARYAIGDTWPDLTIILDVPSELGFSRISERTTSKQTPQGESDVGATALDAMERRSDAFHQRVHENFLLLPGRYPSPVEIVDATGSLEEVVQAVTERVESSLVSVDRESG